MNDGERIQGETIRLSKEEIKYFGAPARSCPITDVKVGPAMENLISFQQNLGKRLDESGYITGQIAEDGRALYEKTELFVAVASAILVHEVETMLINESKRNL